MSRTDKDMPVWASAEYYKPWHAWNCVDAPGFRRGDQPCTLPNKVVRQHPTRKRTVRSCSWEPVWPERRRYRYTWGPRKADKRLYWWNIDRARVRDQMTKAKQQYNGSHEVEIVERVNQHRHAPEGGGWWD